MRCKAVVESEERRCKKTAQKDKQYCWVHRSFPRQQKSRGSSHRTLGDRISGEVKAYYSPKKFISHLKRDSRLVEIGTVFIMMLLGYVLVDVLFGLSGEFFPRNFGQEFSNFYFVFFSILFLFALLAVYIWTLHREISWVNSYVVLLGLALIYILVEGAWRIPAFIAGLLLFLPSVVYHWRKPHWSFFISLLLILTLLVGGLFAIDFVYGKPTIFPLKFNECSNSSSKAGYNLSCSTNSRAILSDHAWYCQYVPELNNVSGSINWTLKNGTEHNASFTNYWVPEKDTAYFEIEVHGINEKNDPICLSVAVQHVFIPEDQNRENREKLITYFLGLLYLAIFIVPSFVKKLMAGGG